MSLQRFKALTFDVMGTLIDYERGMLDYLHQVAPSASVNDSEFLVAYREVRASPQALFSPDDLERVWRELARRFGLPMEAAAGFRASAALWPAFSDSVAALKRLKRHYHLVAATNAQRWAMGYFERTLESPFDWTVTCDDTHFEKPDPRYFVWLKNMLAQQGVRQGDILHVGQSQFHDIRIAQALGWRTCWIERRAGQACCGACRMEPRPALPDWHFTTLRELADAVDAEAQEHTAAMPMFAGGFRAATSAYALR
jgi:putative hydrolase of the HAD superfamily